MVLSVFAASLSSILCNANTEVTITGGSFMRVVIIVLGVAIICVGTLLALFLFVGCPAIPNPYLGCSLGYPFGYGLIWLSLIVGAAVATSGLFVNRGQRRIQ